MNDEQSTNSASENEQSIVNETTNDERTSFVVHRSSFIVSKKSAKLNQLQHSLAGDHRLIGCFQLVLGPAGETAFSAIDRLLSAIDHRDRSHTLIALDLHAPGAGGMFERQGADVRQRRGLMHSAVRSEE